MHMNNKFTKSLITLAVGGLMLAGSASAQTSTTTSGAGPGVVDPGHPRVNQVNRREENQQQRIGNGVKSGLTTYPLLPMNSSTTERDLRNEDYWCPLLDIRTQVLRDSPTSAPDNSGRNAYYCNV